MIIKICESISEASLEKLVSFYNEVQKNKDTATIYLQSGGGDAWAEEAIIDLINTHKIPNMC